MGESALFQRLLLFYYTIIVINIYYTTYNSVFFVYELKI